MQLRTWVKTTLHCWLIRASASFLSECEENSRYNFLRAAGSEWASRSQTYPWRSEHTSHFWKLPCRFCTLNIWTWMLFCLHPPFSLVYLDAQPEVCSHPKPFFSLTSQWQTFRIWPCYYCLNYCPPSRLHCCFLSLDLHLLYLSPSSVPVSILFTFQATFHATEFNQVILPSEIKPVTGSLFLVE